MHGSLILDFRAHTELPDGQTFDNCYEDYINDVQDPFATFISGLFCRSATSYRKKDANYISAPEERAQWAMELKTSSNATASHGDASNQGVRVLPPLKANATPKPTIQNTHPVERKQRKHKGSPADGHEGDSDDDSDKESERNWSELDREDEDAESEPEPREIDLTNFRGTEYERQRAIRIAENKKLLEKLEISRGFKSIMLGKEPNNKAPRPIKPPPADRTLRR
jgi:hypothetical protein